MLLLRYHYVFSYYSHSSHTHYSVKSYLGKYILIALVGNAYRYINAVASIYAINNNTGFCNVENQYLACLRRTEYVTL